MHDITNISQSNGETLIPSSHAKSVEKRTLPPCESKPRHLAVNRCFNAKDKIQAKTMETMHGNNE